MRYTERYFIVGKSSSSGCCIRRRTEVDGTADGFCSVTSCAVSNDHSEEKKNPGTVSKQQPLPSDMVCREVRQEARHIGSESGHRLDRCDADPERGK